VAELYVHVIIMLRVDAGDDFGQYLPEIRCRRFDRMKNGRDRRVVLLMHSSWAILLEGKVLVHSEQATWQESGHMNECACKMRILIVMVSRSVHHCQVAASFRRLIIST